MHKAGLTETNSGQLERYQMVRLRRDWILYFKTNGVIPILDICWYCDKVDIVEYLEGE